MKHIVFDIETVPQDEAKLLALAPEFTAAANLKDPDKIAASIAKKRADYLADAALNWKTAEVVLIGAGDEAEIQSFSAVQALQWPRVNCPDPDKAPIPVLTSLLLYDPFVPASIVPKAVVQATCELSRELILADRTVAPPGEGLKYQNVSGTQTGYDKSDTRPVISRVAQAMLGKYGSLVSGRSGAVRLLRV